MRVDPIDKDPTPPLHKVLCTMAVAKGGCSYIIVLVWLRVIIKISTQVRKVPTDHSNALIHLVLDQKSCLLSPAKWG
ncbi:hypothetical protein BDV12DRAFT_169826 [Aspergillus spectabilis]